MKKAIFSLALAAIGLFAACNKTANSETAADSTATTAQTTDKPAETVSLQGTSSILQGKWKSTTDAQSVVEIAGNKYIEWYGADKMSDAAFKLYDNCPDQQGKETADGTYIVVGEGGEALCYYIIKAATDVLELSYVGRGNTLSFTKVQ